LIEEKIEIEKSILFDEAYSDIAKAILATSKKNPTARNLRLAKHMITFRSYVAQLENDNFVMKKILQDYRDELRKRDTENKVL